MNYDLGTLAQGKPLVWNEMAAPLTRLGGDAGSTAAIQVTTGEEVSTIGLPIGTVTFLLTDIESSLLMWEQAPVEMSEAVAQHHAILDRAVSTHGGVRPQEHGEGDSSVAAFSRASDALSAALQAQLELHETPWPTPKPVRVRMAIHTGEARLHGESNFVGLTITRAARLRKLGHGGQVLVSSASRDLALDQLGDDISMVDLGEHRLKDLARPEHVYELQHHRVKRSFPPLRSLDSFPNNLPVRLSAFIGRQQELRALGELLETHRLVTVVGAGGAGKTRLALQSAAENIDRFGDGVWWVELAPLTHPDGIALAVANAVGASLSESQDHAESIALHLARTRSLLVLDNCEHVLDAVAQLVQTVLQQCPHVQILTTSRAPLEVPGELSWRIPPLALPQRGTGSSLSVERIGQFESVQLFTDRAKSARSTFALSDTNGATVAEICTRLDGIPLAIELAAARTKSLLPSQILEGLDDALRLLSGGSRLLLPRQQTLEASIRWSCALLDDQPRTLLYRLSVFRGSFDLLGAEAVCSDETLAPIEILDALERLVDQSLVVSLDGPQAGRFLLLETVRQFGTRQLVDQGTLEHWHARHAVYYARLAHEIGTLCETGQQFQAVARLAAEHDNLRATLTWLRESGDVQGLGDMVWNLGPFWDIGGDKFEGATWCTRTLAVLPTDPSVLRARITSLRGECRMSLGEWAGCWQDASDGIAMGQQLADPTSHGRASSTMTTILAFSAPLDEWRTRWNETVRLLTESGDLYALGGTLTWGAVPLLRRGYITQGKEALNRARPLLDEIGSPLLHASQQVWESYAAVARGESELAEQLAQRALNGNALGSVTRTRFAESLVDIARSQLGKHRPRWQAHVEVAEGDAETGELLAAGISFLVGAIEVLPKDPRRSQQLIDRWVSGHPSMMAIDKCDALAVAAMAALHLHEAEDALTRCERLVRLATKCESVVYTARGHVWLGTAHMLLNEVTEADRLIRSGIALLWENGCRYDWCESIEALASLAAHCGDAHESARLLGACVRIRKEMHSPRSLTYTGWLDDAKTTSITSLGDTEYERAVDAGAALSDDEVMAYVERTRGTRGRPTIGWQSLTPTELQVAELVRVGLTNRQIADRLLMGAETVKTHASHIFSKLNISKRSQLAAITSEHTNKDRSNRP